MSDPRYPHGPPPRPPSYSDNPFDSPFGGNGSPFGGNGNPFSANAQAPRRQREPAMSTLHDHLTLKTPTLPPRDNSGIGLGTVLLVAGYAAAQYGNYKTASDDNLSIKERKQAVMAMSALSGLVAAPVGAIVLSLPFFLIFPDVDYTEVLWPLVFTAWAIITFWAYKVDHKRIIYRWNALVKNTDGNVEVVKKGFASQDEATHYSEVLVFQRNNKLSSVEEAAAEMLRLQREEETAAFMSKLRAEKKAAEAKRSAEALTRIRSQSREDRVAQWIS